MPHTLEDQNSGSLASYVVGIHEQPKETVDDDGIKKTRVVFLVEIRSTLTPNEGPWGAGGPGGGADIFGLETPTASLAACAVGIPKTGEPMTEAFQTGTLPPAYQGEGGGKWLICQPGYSAKPYKAEKGERARFWLITREYTASLEGLHTRNPQTTNKSNVDAYLNRDAQDNRNTVFAGGVSKISRPFRNSYAACPIKDFMSNANESSELMRQVSYMTVTVDKVFRELYFDPGRAGASTLPVPLTNGYLGGLDTVDLSALSRKYFELKTSDSGAIAGVLSYALNKVNVFPMWGYPPRHVRFEDVTWNRFYDAGGNSYLKAQLTFKIAPPWLTSIPANNPTSKYRSSYGFDEPQIILSNRFLNKELFRRPANSPVSGESENTPRTPTSSGTYDSSTQQMIKGSLEYRRPTPGLFKIPPARMCETGPDMLDKPYNYSGVDWEEWLVWFEGSLVTFPKVLIPSVGWQPWKDSIESDYRLQLTLQANRIAGAQMSPNPTPIEVLNMWSWYVWNPMNYYDTTNLVFDYTTPNVDDPMSVPVAERKKFCQRIEFTDGEDGEEVYWRSSDLAPNVYAAEGDDGKNWVDFIPGMGEEAVKRVNEKGHPIWVNTVATSYNFDKWPGFPYMPGQDMSEMMVYPAVDSGFDFNVFDLPTP